MSCIPSQHHPLLVILVGRLCRGLALCRVDSGFGNGLGDVVTLGFAGGGLVAIGSVGSKAHVSRFALQLVANRVGLMTSLMQCSTVENSDSYPLQCRTLLDGRHALFLEDLAISVLGHHAPAPIGLGTLLLDVVEACSFTVACSVEARIVPDVGFAHVCFAEIGFADGCGFRSQFIPDALQVVEQEKGVGRRARHCMLR
jgi:hypothetical protein